jgi:hypothetical protein
VGRGQIGKIGRGVSSWWDGRSGQHQGSLILGNSHRRAIMAS